MNRLIFLALFFFFSCVPNETSEIDLPAVAFSSPTNTAMAKTLDSLRLRIDIVGNKYQNYSRAKNFQNQAGKEPNIENINLIFRSAYELVLAGKTTQGIEKIEALIKIIIEGPLPPEQKEVILQKLVEQLIVAFMRHGEQVNCIKNHTSGSCILPLSQESIHSDKWGSESAIEKIELLLPKKPDLNYQWLLNVAYMTIGKYPDMVPEAYRLELADINNQEANLKPFKNISGLAGVDDNRLSGGSIIDDFNNDGLLDIVCSSWNLKDPLYIYINNGDGSFTNRYLEAGFKGINGGLNISHVDYNNDGLLDIFVLRGAWLSDGNYPNSLLKNNGDGSFTDVTEKTGILSMHPTQTAAWADYNNDGFVDVFIGNESGKNSPNECELFLNKNGKSFIEVAKITGCNIQGFVKGVSSADYDNDGDTDIYISMLNADNLLLRNEQVENDLGFNFVNVAKETGVTKPLESFPTWFFDYDNDGLEDIFCAGFATSQYDNVAAEYVRELKGAPLSSKFKIYKNLGDGKFTDHTERLGLSQSSFAMGCNFGDIDNDGFLDFYIGNGEPDYKALIPNRLFYNKQGTGFKELTTQMGVGLIQKGHAISFGDLDNDGDQDIYAVMGGAYEGDVFFNALFKNDNSTNNWIKLKLQGTQSNRCGLGARISIKLIDGSGKERYIKRSINSGSSFGQNPYLQEIGLGQDERLAELEIYWPKSKIRQIFKDVEINKGYKIEEGNNTLLPYELKSIDFSKLKTKAHHHHH